MTSKGVVASGERQRLTLLTVLMLNLLLFFSLAGGGWIAGSSALIANALANLSDAAVYAVTLASGVGILFDVGKEAGKGDV